MKTLVVANQKGGVGKTATIVHLAFYFFEKGLRVGLIDLDLQGNASYTMSEYKTGCKSSELFNSSQKLDPMRNLPREGALIALIESDPELASLEKASLNSVANYFVENVQSLREYNFDIVLFDTAPSLGVAMASALCAANYVLSPIELEAYSIQGIKKMLTTVMNIKKVNDSLEFLGMMPSKVDSRNPRHKRHLEELKAAYPSLLLPREIGLRSGIADALSSGVPVWEIKKTAARVAGKEMRSMAEYVYESINFDNEGA